MRIAINGFGRIGKTFLRCLLSDPTLKKQLEVAIINIGPDTIEHTAHLFKYDSLMGTYQGDVRQEKDHIIIDGHKIAVIACMNPDQLPWKSHAIDWVVDCSGKFTQRKDAEQHLQAGAHAVLISAPAHDEDVTIIPGVNESLFNPQKHRIVSLGSCTTNALVPVLHVVHTAFTIQHCSMTTIHAYTNSQALLDVDRKNVRNARAAALNIIPASTGALKVAGKVIPALQGKIEAVAVRVPVAKVSLLDLTFQTQQPISIDALNAACIKAAHGSLRGIMQITDQDLVSSDFSGNNHSVIIDTVLTKTNGTFFGKLFGWYDNEWGYSMRLKDFLLLAAQR